MRLRAMYYNVLAVLIILFTSVCHLQQCFICAVYMSYILLSASWCLMSYSSKCRIMKCYCYSEIYYILCRIIKRSGCYISVMSYNVLTVLNVSYTSTCRFIKWLFCSYYILLCIVSYNVLAALFMSCTSECCMVCIMFWLFRSFSCHMQVWVSTRAVLLSGVIYFLVSVYTTFWLFCSFHILLRVWLNHILTVSCVEYFCLSWTTKFRLFCLCHIYLSVVSCNVLYVSYTSAYRVIHCSCCSACIIYFMQPGDELSYILFTKCCLYQSLKLPSPSIHCTINYSKNSCKEFIIIIMSVFVSMLAFFFFWWTLIIKTQTMYHFKDRPKAPKISLRVHLLLHELELCVSWNTICNYFTNFICHVFDMNLLKEIEKSIALNNRINCVIHMFS